MKLCQRLQHWTTTKPVQPMFLTTLKYEIASEFDSFKSVSKIELKTF